jgi:hypothetical protein
LYLRTSEEHDRRNYELLKGEIDSILVFVSHCVGYHHDITIYSETIVRFVLRHSCGIDSAIDLWLRAGPLLLGPFLHGPE